MVEMRGKGRNKRRGEEDMQVSRDETRPTRPTRPNKAPSTMQKVKVKVKDEDGKT